MATTPQIIDVPRRFLVYSIRNKKNGQYYIGITSMSLERRMKGHLDDVRRGSKCAVHNAIRKHGIASFEVSLVDDSAKNWKELCEKEKLFIQSYDSYTNGYNATLGGDGKFGCSPSKETREKISVSMKGKNRYKRTKEHREKLAAAMTGRKHSEDTKRKISDSNKGKKLSLERIEQMRRVWMGRKHSEESKRKISLAKSDSHRYLFYNKKLDITEYMTARKLREKYKLKRYETSRIICGTRKTAKGWEVV